MADILYLALTLAFFIATAGIVYVFEGLREHK
jgi:hypothetical protein